MAARSIASLSLTFGLVSIPVKLYSATESSAALRFKLMSSSGAALRQQFVADATPPRREEPRVLDEPDPVEEAPVAHLRTATPKVIDITSSRRDAPPAPPSRPAADPGESIIQRSSMVKGYEYEKGKFVLFTPEELKALESGSRKTIDIMSFIPLTAVDPIYYDKAYFLAPDKHGSKPYSLLLRAMHDTSRCALARWAFRSKEYVVQIRPADNGLVLQQLLYAEEVRAIKDLHIENTEVGDAELNLAKQLIAQIATDSYDPTEFVDEEKKRILEAVERKIAGKDLASAPAPARSGKVVDLLEALHASLRGGQPGGEAAKGSKPARGERRPAKRASAKSGVAANTSSRIRSGRR